MNVVWLYCCPIGCSRAWCGWCQAAYLAGESRRRQEKLDDLEFRLDRTRTTSTTLKVADDRLVALRHSIDCAASELANVQKGLEAEGAEIDLYSLELVETAVTKAERLCDLLLKVRRDKHATASGYPTLTCACVVGVHPAGATTLDEAVRG